MLSYESQFADVLAVLDEIAAMTVAEFTQVEDEMCQRFVAALADVTEEATRRTFGGG